MDTKLSIIIPCYNCEKTLEQAVESCYTQDLDNFEIVMVDDGSTDDTWKLMNVLANKYPKIALLKHTRNRGGGAARNTAINTSTGDLIFCLDSDDILPPDTLLSLIHTLLKERVDGVAFGSRRFFLGNNTDTFTIHENPKLDRPLTITDFFDSRILINNFLYTRKAYNVTGGYPEHHAFDTQSFELRFLSKGLSLIFDHQVTYLHRQAHTVSYFEREYRKGNNSRNFYLSLEDILHLFSDSALKFIEDYDIFVQNSSSTNLLSDLKKYYSAVGKNMFIENYTSYLSAEGQEKYYLHYSHLQDENKWLPLWFYDYSCKDYKNALDHIYTMCEKRHTSKILYYNNMRTLMALSGDINCENNIQDLLSGLQPVTIYSRLGILGEFLGRFPVLKKIYSSVIKYI